MTDQGSNFLLCILKSSGEELRRELINETGMDRVYAVEGDRREWRGPALMNNLSFAGFDLNDLPQHLYSDPGPYLYADCADIWNESVEEMFARRSVAIRAALYFPSIAFEERNGAALVQLMVALWWQHRWAGQTLEVTKERIEMHLGGHALGLDQRTAFYYQDRRRLPRGNIVSPSEIVASPLGRPRLANSHTTAVFRHLCHALPDRLKEIDVIFASAVMAGPEFQAALTNHFDIEGVSAGSTEPSLVWKRARKIISTAKLNPCVELRQLFGTRLSYAAFTSRFGIAKVVEGKPYTPLLRDRHMKAIDELEGIGAKAAVVESVGDPGAAVANLLKFQAAMGGQS